MENKSRGMRSDLKPFLYWKCLQMFEKSFQLTNREVKKASKQKLSEYCALSAIHWTRKSNPMPRVHKQQLSNYNQPHKTSCTETPKHRNLLHNRLTSKSSLPTYKRRAFSFTGCGTKWGCSSWSLSPSLTTFLSLASNKLSNCWTNWKSTHCRNN